MLLQVGAARSREAGHSSRFKSGDLSDSRDAQSMASRQRQPSGQVPPPLLAPTRGRNKSPQPEPLLPQHFPGSILRARFWRSHAFAAEGRQELGVLPKSRLRLPAVLQINTP